MTSNTVIQNVNFAPLRSFGDFTARFQLPTFNDLEKWGNRVVKNLMYYQTNYIAIFITTYVVMLITTPTKIICGLIVKAGIVTVLKYCLTNDGRSFTGSSYKWTICCAPIFLGYLVLMLFDAILITLFSLLLPFCLTFIHSSLRLRNIRNKVVNTMETFGSNTPMGIFLNAVNVTADKLNF